MVTLGALLGHLICTGAAVKLGYWISGKVTEKQVLTVGGIVFIISGLCTLYLAFEDKPEWGWYHIKLSIYVYFRKRKKKIKNKIFINNLILLNISLWEDIK